MVRLLSGAAHLQVREHLVNGERARFLSRRVVFECRQELANKDLRRDKEIDPIYPPALVTDTDMIRQLEGVGAEIEYLR